MLKRVLSALVLLPLLFYVVLRGNFTLKIAIIVISFMGLKELYTAFKAKSLKPMELLGYLASFVLILSFEVSKKNIGISITLFLTMIICAVRLLKKKNDFMDIISTLFGIIYVPYFLMHIYYLKTFNNPHVVWLVFIVAWTTDTFAYFSGYFFGKHKLIPSISPKKTVEGSIGGTLGSIISCMIFGHFIGLEYIQMFFLGAFGSACAQLGDLFASGIKRDIGIKDYGDLIPGHGGILDRFDSILFVAPFVYYFSYFFIF